MDGGVNYNYVQLLELWNKPESGSGSVEATKVVEKNQQTERSTYSEHLHGSSKLSQIG